MPEAYRDALSQAEVPTKPLISYVNSTQTSIRTTYIYRAPQFVAGGTASFGSLPQQRDRDDYNERAGPDRQLEGPRAPTIGAQQNNDPQYSTFEEAEEAYIKLLRRSNVKPDWTWEQTMRATIKDPQYRALKDPKDRKQAFEKYAQEVRAQEKDRAKERLAKLRVDFGTMLKSHPEIKHYTRWKTARPIIEGETIFRSTNDDTERRQLFEEYIIELRKANIDRQVALRASAMDDLVGLLKGLKLEPYTRWQEAQEVIESSETFQADDKFKSLSKSDILTAFENHIKSLERTFNDERQREKNSKQRRERQNRDRFIDLLKELRSGGKLKAGTKWMEILPHIDSDPRYVAMLGQPGSTPLDLFWDMVEEAERSFRLIRNEIYDVLEDRRYEILPVTKFTDFLAVMTADRRTATVPPDVLELAFNRILEKVHRRIDEDKHASERQQRRALDALRSKIKHLDRPPVTSISTWESVKPHISQLDEYKALPTDDLRKQAFDKVLRRLKEKEDDVENERRAGRRPDREHDHRGPVARDIRNGHAPSSRHHAPIDRDRHERRGTRNSRTPELDAYEADRRKAMADRERQYHKNGPTGLSPPPPRSRERDRRERDRTASHPRRGSLYDRDRRDREEERERAYRSRADPRERPHRDGRDVRDGLDYGDGGSIGSGGRRRREPESDGESVGSGRKRLRRERKRTPPVVEEKKEEVAVHSGSEEGEMVEEE